MPSPDRVMVARLQVLAAACIFSTGGAAIKATSLSGLQVASFRSGVAALALLLVLPSARRALSLRAALVGIAYAGTLVFFVLSTKLTTAANAIFLQSTAPLYLVVLGPWLLKERIHRRDVAFMVALGVGLAMAFFGGQQASVTAPDPVRGNVFAVCSGVFWAFTMIGLRWLGRTEDASPGSAGASVILGNLIAFLVCLPGALPVATVTSKDWLLVVYLGVVQIGLAYVLLTIAFRHLRALEASLLLLTEPMLNPIGTWLVHGETPGAWSLAGGAIILSASLAQSLAQPRVPPSLESPGVDD